MNLLCMQTKSDAERITQLGAPAGRVKVTGNMKFDVWNEDAGFNKKNPASEFHSQQLLIAGSTHKGEEEIILEVYSKLTKKFHDLQLLIAPRHIDRADSIKKLVGEKNLEKTVSILDTHGELSRLYSLATIVFMGGSLVKRGGHNIIEPARFAKPIVFGPHMFNFRDMARLFLENRAARQIKDKDRLFETLEDLLENKDKQSALGRNAKNLIDQSRGATERNIREAEAILSQ